MVGTVTTARMPKGKLARGIRALQAGTLTPRMILAFLLALVLFVASAVLIVWTRDQVVRYGYEINHASVTLSELKFENRKLLKKQYELFNLERLHRRSQELGLNKPQTHQLLVIYESEPSQNN